MEKEEELIDSIGYLYTGCVKELITQYNIDNQANRIAKMENAIRLANEVKEDPNYQILIREVFQHLIKKNEEFRDKSKAVMAQLDYSCDLDYITCLKKIFLQEDIEVFKCWEHVFLIISKSIYASKFDVKFEITKLELEESDIQYFIDNYESFNDAINYIIRLFDLYSDSGFKYIVVYDTERLYRFYRILACNLKAEINKRIISLNLTDKYPNKLQTGEFLNYYNGYNFIYYLKDIISNRLEITEKQVKDNIETAETILTLVDELIKEKYDISEFVKYINELFVIFEKRMSDYSILEDSIAIDKYKKTKPVKSLKYLKKVITGFDKLKSITTKYISEQNEKIALLGDMDKEKLKLVIGKAKDDFSHTEHIINDCIEKTDILLSIGYDKQLSRQNTNFHFFRNIIFAMLKLPNFMNDLDVILEFYLKTINYLRPLINESKQRLITKKILNDEIKFIGYLTNIAKSYKEYKYMLNSIFKILFIEFTNENRDYLSAESCINKVKNFVFDICKNDKKRQYYIKFMNIKNMIFEISLNENESAQNKRKILSDFVMLSLRENGKDFDNAFEETLDGVRYGTDCISDINNLKSLVEHIINFLIVRVTYQMMKNV